MGLLGPFANASPVSGTIAARGSITLPPSSVLESGPLAVFAEDLDADFLISGNYTSLHILVYEKRYATASIPGLRPSLTIGEQTHEWDVSDAAVSILPGHPGWIGLYPQHGRLAETPEGPITLRSQVAESIGNGHLGSENGDPEHPSYAVTLERPVFIHPATQWGYSGAGALKIVGPTLTIASPENAITIETGEFEDPQAPAQTVRRWVQLEFARGQTRAQSLTSTVASEIIEATWTGPVGIEDANAQLAGGLMEWEAPGGAQVIDGTFTATLTAIGEDVTAIILAGNYEKGTLSTEVSASTTARGTAILLFLAIGTVLGGSAAYRVHKRRRGKPRLDAEAYARAADSAADADDHERAAKLYEFAREESPTSVRLTLDHAFAVAQAGHVPGAIRILDKSLAGNDPDALCLLARLHTQNGDPARAEAALVRALDADPILILDIEGDAELEPLLARDAARAAARRAHRALR